MRYRGIQVAKLSLRPFTFPSAPRAEQALRFREGEEDPVPHGQCSMPARVPYGSGGCSVTVIPSLSTFHT